VRCAECERETSEAARFCECCGRELTREVAHHVEPPASAALRHDSTPEPAIASYEPGTTAASMEANDWAPNPESAPGQKRCPSCNGPSVDGKRCEVCRDVATAETLSHPTPDAASFATNSSAVFGGPEVPIRPELSMNLPVEPPPPPVRKMTPEERLASARATAAETVRRAQEKAANPPVLQKRPMTPLAPPRRRYHPLELAAASLVVAALGAGAVWDRLHHKATPARSQQMAAVQHGPTEPQAVEPVRHTPPPVEKPVAKTPDPIAPVAKTLPPVAANATPVRPAAPAPMQPATPVKQAAAPPAKQQIPPPSKSKPTPASTKPADLSARDAAAVLAANQKKTVAPSRNAPRVVVPVENKTAAAPGPASEKPVALAAAAPPVVAEPEPKAPAPVAAVGPFFEPNQVNEAPRIVSRGQVRLPSDLRSVNEVVVVRALVSQSGQPSRVSLLRRSKAGAQLDDVVLEAVNQWTFSPAKKKGEAVSCWFNFAVPVGGE
jgi:TonB family protein